MKRTREKRCTIAKFKMDNGRVAVEEVRSGMFKLTWFYIYKATGQEEVVSHNFQLVGSQAGQNYSITCNLKPQSAKNSQLRYIDLSLKGVGDADLNKMPGNSGTTAPVACTRGQLVGVRYVCSAGANEGSEIQLAETEPGTWQLSNISSKFKNHHGTYQEVNIQVWMDFVSPGAQSKVDGLAELYANQAGCDVELHSKDGILRAHAAILVAGSPVIRDSFKFAFDERKTWKLDMTDYDAKLVDQFLLYLYTGRAPKLAEDGIARHLYELADKYRVASLKEDCARFLASRFTTGNVVETLFWAHSRSAGNLFDAATSFIAFSGRQLCSSPQWKELMSQHPDVCLMAYQGVINTLAEAAGYKTSELTNERCNGDNSDEEDDDEINVDEPNLE